MHLTDHEPINYIITVEKPKHDYCWSVLATCIVVVWLENVLMMLTVNHTHSRKVRVPTHVDYNTNDML